MRWMERSRCVTEDFTLAKARLMFFDHYTMIDSRFCEVEQDGNISKKDRGTKICSSKIKIKAELKLADMINLGVEWLKEITSPEKIKTSMKDNSSGNGAQIGSSGDGAINGDYTGISNEEAQEIDDFVKHADGCPVGVDWETEGFYSYNDANAIGGTCVDIIFSKYNQ